MNPRGFASVCIAGLVTWFGTAALASNGVVIFDLAGNSQDLADSITVSPTGRIYATAQQLTPTPEGELLALDSTGSLVSTFGTRGHIHAVPLDVAYTAWGLPLIARADDSVTLSFRGNFSNYDRSGAQLLAVQNSDIGFDADMTLQSDGKYVLFGDMSLTPQGIGVLKRFNTDGTPDTTLGGTGTVLIGGGNAISDLHVVALPDGKILAALAVYPDGVVAVYRVNNDGSLDLNFGTNGLVTLPISCCGPRVAPLAFDAATNKIYVGANGSTTGGDSVLTRLNYSDGAVDSTFPGISLINQLQPSQFVLDSSGRIVMFGTINNPSNTVSDGYVARFLSTGLADSSFGTGGATTIHVGDSSQLSALRHGALQPDGKLLAILTTTGPSDAPPSLNGVVTDIAIARLNTDGTLDTQFGVNQPDSKVYPDAYTIPADTAPYGTVSVISSPVTITGINSPTSVALVDGGGDFSVGCTGTFTSTRDLISNGQTLCVRHSATAPAGGISSTIIDVGGRRGTYTTTSTSTAATTTPDAFTFTAQTGVAVGATVVSNAVTITGITGAAPITIQGGDYSIGCTQSFTNQASTISGGQTVCVRQTAASQTSTDMITTLTIGGVSAQFKSTTAAATGGGGGGGGTTSVVDVLLLAALQCLRLLQSRGSRLLRFASVGSSLSSFDDRVGAA